MTQPNLQVNAEGGISDEVCAEIIQSIRFVPNFPKPVFSDPCARDRPGQKRHVAAKCALRDMRTTFAGPSADTAEFCHIVQAIAMSVSLC